MPKQPGVSRREFLSKSIVAIGSFIGASLLYTVGKFVISPSLKKRANSWAEVGPVEELKDDVPTRATYTIERSDGWIERTDIKTAWVRRYADGRYDVFDPKCTHLGCPYYWDEASKSFLCPCHTAGFDITGKVIAGPPPKPLSKYAYKVEKGKLYLQE